jgi:hypothetical protein
MPQVQGPDEDPRGGDRAAKRSPSAGEPRAAERVAAPQGRPSDGQPTDSSPDRILEEVRTLNAQRRLTISTIGLGGDQNERFLAALASENGGHYVRK